MTIALLLDAAAGTRSRLLALSPLDFVIIAIYFATVIGIGGEVSSVTPLLGGSVAKAESVPRSFAVLEVIQLMPLLMVEEVQPGGKAGAVTESKP